MKIEKQNKMDEQIQFATKDEINKILPAFLELRPHRNETELRQLLMDAFNEGYQVIYIGDDSCAYSVLGFRILHFIFTGKTLKVDDLVTLSGYKGKGYASKLFSWVKKFAIKQNCHHLGLDSGFLRRDAHRFYLNQGLFMSPFTSVEKFQNCNDHFPLYS